MTLPLPPIFYVLHLLSRAFHEAVDVVIHLGVSDPEVRNAVVRAAVVSGVAEPVVELIPEVGVVFVAFVSVPDAAEPRVSVDTPFAFRVLDPVSAFVVEVHSLGLPTFLVSPNVD